MSENEPRELTCFVVIGFGRKTDFRTGRTLDLDLSYSKLIKPACDRVEGVRINCFRAIDVNLAGSIDKIMYHWLYHADVVIADLSTQNSNAMYELGVRHAQKPNTTILISEDGIFSALPFDLSHTIIYAYKHLGEEIADEEAERFTSLLADNLGRVLAPVERQNDSPIYTYMEGMEAPKYVAPADRIKQLEAALAGQGEGDTPTDVSGQAVAALVAQAERAKKDKKWDLAISLVDAAIAQMEETSSGTAEGAEPAGGMAVSREVFLYQRKALLTYKQSENNPSDDEEQNRAAIVDLHAAMNVLSEADDPLESNDPETLGLAGAINKRLWERTEDARFLDLSILFYERGFYIAQDYYNGINVAYMYSVKADLSEDFFDATVNFGHASLLREKVARFCEKMRTSEEWTSRGDKVWVLATLAEAYFASGQKKELDRVLPELEAMNDSFAMDAYQLQLDKLKPMMERFEARRVSETRATAAAESGESIATSVVTTGPARAKIHPPGAIVIDLGSEVPPKSVELDIKVDY